MTTSAYTNNPAEGRFSVPLFLALIIAGLAGNYFRYPIFLNIDFLFGSIFAMLALQLFGLGRGIFAAAIIAGYTLILWNHPYAIIIMTAEVAIVGWLTIRRKIGMVLADALFWLIIGIPLVYLFYHVVMNTPLSNTMIVMTKQAVNGIANALVARLIFTGYGLRSRSSLTTYREVFYNLLAFFVLCPALIILAVGSRNDFNETDILIRTSLVQDGQRVKQRLETWVLDRKTAIISLSGLAAKYSPQEMQHRLEETHQSDHNFEIIALLNKEATTTAYSPLIDKLGQSTIGKSYADRPYLPMLKQTLKPMLTEVAMSRFGIPRPLVRMVAPVVVRGGYAGYVSGVLKLEQIQEYLNISVSRHSSLYTLLDKNGNIISTNHPDQTIMKPLVHAKGNLNRLDNNISQWIPTLPRNTPISERWKKSNYIFEVGIGEMAEWKLVLEQPVAPFQKSLYDKYTGKLSLLFVILLGSLALAELFTKRAIFTLEKLTEITRDLPIRLVANDNKIVWPESGIDETKQLIDNFRDMTEVLAAVFVETRHINQVLERQVTERTRELQQAKEAAEVANLAKSRFLSVVAHEFHTPLGLLTVSTDILDRYWERLSPQERLEQHEQIRKAARQMTQLVDSVLAFNRQETTTVPMALDIGQVCREIAEEVNAVWGAEHKFIITIDPVCGKHVLDKILFRRVLSNLLTNAFRFTPSGGTVSLTVSRQTDRLLIELADSGIGIPEEEQQKVFEAFYRSSNVDARSGLGLGLSIVSEALEQMNGSITMTSSVGAGTTFCVELPVEQE